jgi:predicted transcriptional regulator
MKRTTVMIDDLIYEQLRSLARRQGTTTSSVLREAVARYVVAESTRSEPPLADCL